MRVLAFVLALTLAAVPARAADAINGKSVYDRWCSDCHAATGGRPGIPPPGWNVLQQRYKGSVPGEIDQRTDMTADYIKTIVRNGINVMPKTRKTEITDGDLDDLTAYLLRPRS